MKKKIPILEAFSFPVITLSYVSYQIHLTFLGQQCKIFENIRCESTRWQVKRKKSATAWLIQYSRIAL